MAVTRAEVAEWLNDAGYILGLFAVAEVVVTVHPTIAAYLGIAATGALGLANRVNPPAPIVQAPKA